MAIQKGDPSRDGLSGQLSYTYTKALMQYGNLPNGTNAIDYLNDYIKAFNALTSAGGGAQCYGAGSSATPGAPTSCSDPTAIRNPYYNESVQPLLKRDAYYAEYPNEPPNDPTDDPGSTAITPHMFAGWIQYKHGRWAIAPNFELQAGTYYGAPTDTYGVDPRNCAQNEAAATGPTGAHIVSAGSPTAQYPDFLSCGASTVVQSGFLAIPNPYTGKMDGMGQFQQPWQFNMGALIRYDVSPRVTASLTLTNIVNYCFGGSKTPWSSKFGPNSYVCGYGMNNGYFGNYVGPLPGQAGFGGGFYYGASPTAAENGSPVYAPAFNYPWQPLIGGALPFQAYLEVQIKL